MDQGVKAVKERNPREKASFLSTIFFYFAWPIVKKGHQKDLQEKDIYGVLPKFESNKLGNEVEHVWTDRRSRLKSSSNFKQNGLKDEFEKLPSNEKEIQNVSVFKCLMSKFGCYYFCLGLMQLCARTTVSLLQPWAVSKFVAFFTPGQTEILRSDAYKYAFLLISVIGFNYIYNHNYQQLIMEFAVRVRTSLCSLIYRKALKLSPAAFSDGKMGKVVTLVTKDVFCVDSSILFFNDIWVGVIQVIVATVLIYTRIGPSVFVGIGFLLLIVIIQAYCGRKSSLTRLLAAKKAEERIQLIQSVLNAIRIIKMYTWEHYFEKLINSLRMKETDKLKIIYYLKVTILTLGGLAIKFAFFLLIMTYTLTGQTVSAEKVYFVQQCFNAILRSPVTTSFPMGIASLAELAAALKRFEQFLNAPEFQPRKNVKFSSTKPKVQLSKVSVNIDNQEVLRSVSLDIETGLLIVSGDIGSGKSSLLKVILNEYPITSGQIVVRGSVSYSPEEPWLFPSTIRQNILFGQPWNQQRYQEVLNVCALTHDLNQFEKLDHTVVGDKGVNLSKGQQARICLARAVYKDSDIYLLDDCLSALDAQVNAHVFKECIKGFLKDKLVILISNNINNLKQQPTGGILYMENGATLDLEQQKAALDKRITYFIDEDNPLSYDDDSDNEEITSESDNLLQQREATEPKRNLYYEENKQGSVLWENYIAYYRYAGGVGVLIFVVLVFIATQAALSYSEIVLSTWVTTEAKILNLARTNGTEDVTYQAATVKRSKLINLYAILVTSATAAILFRSFCSFYFCIEAGRKLHKVLVQGLLSATMTFFDQRFIGNIVNRVSKDFHTIDENIPQIIYENLRSVSLVISIMALLLHTNYYFLIEIIALFLIMMFMQRYYLPTGRSLKRLEAATRSPMIGYINASLEGLTTVHAAQEERLMHLEFDKHQDLFTSVYYMNQCTSRAFAFSIDMTCLVFISSIILSFAFSSKPVPPGDVGMAVTQAMMLSGLLQWAFRQMVELENAMTSVERVLEYAGATAENRTGNLVENWPQIGRIKYDRVSLTYKSTKEKVLKNVSFQIEGGSKVGIVGRTGAGKSSIVSVLFRLYDYEGLISIDGVDIKTLPLEYLRLNIGIIPQDPILFSGTIRSNIDPLNRYEDSEIWTAIEKVQLKNSISSLDQTIISGGQQQFSAGQRQLLCMARALVCKNQIIVLDEATAHMDQQTDQKLQKAIQEHFANCTVLIIAHRLQSFQTAHKILVIEDGNIVQFDSPSALLLDEDGPFYKMVRNAGGLDFF